MLLCSAAAVAQNLALLTQVLRMFFALVRHVQPVRFLQRTLEQRDTGALSAPVKVLSLTLMQMKVGSSGNVLQDGLGNLEHLAFFLLNRKTDLRRWSSNVIEEINSGKYKIF